MTQATWRTGKKLYASEDGSTYGDAAGGLQRVYDIHQEHIVSLSQGSNFWYIGKDILSMGSSKLCAPLKVLLSLSYTGTRGRATTL